jgi:hypothetical protein
VSASFANSSDSQKSPLRTCRTPSAQCMTGHNVQRISGPPSGPEIRMWHRRRFQRRIWGQELAPSRPQPSPTGGTDEIQPAAGSLTTPGWHHFDHARAGWWCGVWCTGARAPYTTLPAAPCHDGAVHWPIARENGVEPYEYTNPGGLGAKTEQLSQLSKHFGSSFSSPVLFTCDMVRSEDGMWNVRQSDGLGCSGSEPGKLIYLLGELRHVSLHKPSLGDLQAASRDTRPCRGGGWQLRVGRSFMAPSRISGWSFTREPTLCLADVVVPNEYPSTPHWPNTHSMYVFAREVTETYRVLNRTSKTRAVGKS